LSGEGPGREVGGPEDDRVRRRLDEHEEQVQAQLEAEVRADEEEDAEPDEDPMEGEAPSG
jgi:hypothetical protein